MSELLGLAPEVVGLADNPIPIPPQTNADRWSLQMEADGLTQQSWQQARNYHAAFERARETLAAEGVVVDNPYGTGTDVRNDPTAWNPLDFGGIARRTMGEMERQRRLAAWDAATQRLLERRPDLTDLDTTALRRQADERARRAALAAAQAEDMGGGLGAFAASVVSTFTDPVQLATLPFGAGARVGSTVLGQILRTAAIEGGVAAATQAAVEATGAAAYRASLGLPDTVAENVLMAGAAGAIIGGGLRGILAGAERLGLIDVRAQAQAQLAAGAGNPAGPAAAPAHNAALNAAGQAVATGQVAAVQMPAASSRVPVIDATDEATAVAEITRMRTAPGGVSWALRFGRIEGALADRIRQDAGQEVTGFEHIMQSDEVRHALRRHGEGGPDIRVRPITPEDIARAPEWFATADSIRFDGTNHLGLPVLRAEKDLADGTVAIIEQVRATRQRLAFTSLFFVRGKGGPPGSTGSPPVSGVPPSERPGTNPGQAVLEIAPNLTRFNAYTPAGRSVLVEPQVVELRTLVPSHLEDGNLNPAYPHAEGIQPRDRGAAPSRDQVRAIAAGLQPDRLRPNPEAGFGAPIVADDLVVESGNGRIMALRQVYGDPTLAGQADAYRQALLAQGFDLTGLSQPVLVSRRVSALTAEERRAFVQEANGRGVLAQSSAERARADARLVDDALPLWRGGEMDSAANADFVRRVLAQMTPEERGSLLDKDGRLTAEGTRRLQAAMLARAYGDALGPLLDRFLDTGNEGLRGVAGGLTDVAGAWSVMRRAAADGAIDAGMDTTADLAAAVRTIDEARTKGLAVPDLLAQADFDRPPLTDAGLAMLAALMRGEQFGGGTAARQTIAARLNGYVTEAMKAQPGPGLFGLPPVRPQDALQAGARAGGDPVPTFRFDPPQRPPEAPAAKDQIADILDAMAGTESEYWGIRVIDNEAPPLGATLPPSRVWVDGEPTEELLNGTSAIIIEHKSKQAVSAALTQAGIVRDPKSVDAYYYGQTVMLVRGDQATRGEDAGEIIIRDATVERVYRKSTAGKSWFESSEAPDLSIERLQSIVSAEPKLSANDVSIHAASSATNSFGQNQSPSVNPAADRQTAVAQASRQAEADLIAAEPRLADVDVLEAQRIAAAADMQVPDTAAAAGNVDAGDVPMRSARDLLDEAESMIADARQAGLCLLGGTA